MEKEQIKNRVNSYLKEFKENSGTFKSCEIIFNYITFLKSESYLQELLSDIFDYAEKQIELTEKIIKDNSKEAKKLDNFTFNPKDISNVSDIPIFKKELSKYSEAVKNKENIPATFALSIYLVPFLFIANAFKSIKEKQKENNDKEVKRLVEILKDESLSIAYLPIKDKGSKTVTSDKLYYEYMRVINKYISDIIDSEAFLDKNEMGKSTKYYQENPKARKKKAQTDKKINARPEQIKKRTECGRKRKEAKKNGKSIAGKDYDHATKRFVKSSTNRGRRGEGNR